MAVHEWRTIGLAGSSGSQNAILLLGVTEMGFIGDALAANRAILHTMGPHAEETPEVFIRRKRSDIERLGYTYWYERSVRPPAVQPFCRESDRAGLKTYVLFYEREPKDIRKGRHAGQPPKPDFGYMTRFSSEDREIGQFCPIDLTMGYVTGRLDRGACGIVLDHLEVVDPEQKINIAEWTPKPNARAGAWCAVRTQPTIEIKYCYVVAVARLTSPYGVWFQGVKGKP
jgi:hypothetical protein